MSAIKLEPPVTGDNLFTKQRHTDTYSFIDARQCDLSGKTILVSGASKGIGKATAIAFAQAGASNIVLLARSDLTAFVKDVEQAAVEAQRQKPNVLIIKCDVTSVPETEHAAEQVASAFGQLDILINNAGYLEKWKKVHESDPEEWWKSMEVNFKGVYLMCRAFIPLLLKGSEKTIIQVSSIGAVAVMPGASAYQVAKQALLRLNDFLTAEYAEEGLLAYAIHPGGVKTELALGMPDYMHEHLTDEPELPANTLVWLTKERRTWLADRYVNVQWDMEELEARREEIEAKGLLTMRLRS